MVRRKTEKDYNPGEKVYYKSTDGSIFLVEVLKNDSGERCPQPALKTAGYVGYDLKILEVIKIVDPANFRVTPKPGLEFGIQKLDNFACAGSDWELSDKMFDD